MKVRSPRSSKSSQRSSARQSMTRWPALVLIPALIVAGALFGQDDDAPADDAIADAQPEALGPVIASADSLGAFWFCSGGTGIAGGAADHTVVAINSSDEPRTVTITVYGTRAEGGERPEPVAQQASIAAYGRLQWRLGDLLAAEFVSATVEVDGGGVVVERIVQGPTGADAGPCSSTASDAWSVPVGGTDTTADNTQRREILVFFNPFPADAVLDVRFSTDSGERGVPDKFLGLVVPGRGVVAADVAAFDVTVSPEVNAMVTARAGRVVVDRLQMYNPPEPGGVALSTGIPALSGTWVFPAGNVNSARREALVVANPGELPAEVDVEIRPEDSELSTEPFELTVQPRRHVLLDLAAEERMNELLSQNAAYSIIVRTADGTSVAAERVLRVPPDQPGAGAATGDGSAIAGNKLVAEMSGAQPGSLLTLFNPSEDSVAQVKVSIIANGQLIDPLGATDIAIQPGRRVTLPVESLATGTFAVLLESTTPVMAERDVILPVDRYLAMAPVDAASARVVDLSVFDVSDGN